jgi:DNA mismatch repair protein MutL
VFIIFIDINPSLIDVNIHPTKQDIKFVNQSEMSNILENIIDNTLNRILSIPKVTFTKEKVEENQNELPLLYEKAIVDNSYLNVIEEKKLINSAKESHSESSNMNNIDSKINYYEELTCNKNSITQDSTNQNFDNQLDISLKNSKILGVLFSTYILMENPQMEKVFVVDQHAAHERVMYERYKKEYKSEKVVIQNLLTPEIVELSNPEIETVMENIQFFNNLGFIIEEFGNNSVIIRGVPILFGKPQIKELFMDLLDTIALNIKSSYEIKLDKIIKMACTKAIKSGDIMDNVEIRSLIDQLSKCKNPYTCPHGRPTIIEISKKDIEKEFKRIM